MQFHTKSGHAHSSNEHTHLFDVLQLRDFLKKINLVFLLNFHQVVNTILAWLVLFLLPETTENILSLVTRAPFANALII